MKQIGIIAVLISVLSFSSCSSNSKNFSDINLDERTDSLKWLFYAYTYKGKVLFNKTQSEYDPVECDANIENVIQKKGTLFCLLVYYKNGIRVSKIREGLNINGFTYFSGVAKPLTGALVFDDFEKLESLKKDNRVTDSTFMVYLKQIDTAKISYWLKNEARRRKVF
jgi:hypothetical protein